MHNHMVFSLEPIERGETNVVTMPIDTVDRKCAALPTATTCRKMESYSHQAPPCSSPVVMLNKKYISHIAFVWTNGDWIQ